MKLCVHVCTCVCVAAVLTFSVSTSSAQTTRSIFSNLTNPSIGMNALFSGQIAPDIDEPYTLFDFQGADVSMISVVDPYWTFWANLAFTPEEVSPEEIVARCDRIPNLQLRVGKLRAKFGKHALLHRHAFPFVQAPVIIGNTIGEEGFKDSGLEASWLTPVSWYSELTAGFFKAIDQGEENPLDFGSMRRENIPYLVHFMNQFDLNESTTLEIGQSYLAGRGADGHRHTVFGADLTVRNVPLRQSNSRGWILQSEYMQKGSYEGGNYLKEQRGWYASFKYRLSQRWWVGIRGEQGHDCTTDVLVDQAGDPIWGKVSRASADITWAPSEFSYLRLEYSVTKADDGSGFKPQDRRLMLQMSTTIGYHPAHAY